MSQRRKVSSEVSGAVLDYLLKHTGMTQETLAEALEVSAAFISRVRTRERSLTIDHLGAIETLLKVPLGAILLAAVPLSAVTPRTKMLHDLARRAIVQADIAAKATVRLRV